MDIVEKLICYCFGYTVDDILRDYRKNGQSTIEARIQREKKLGGCQCAANNPKGQ